jgi:hypothetical protein
VPERSSIQGRRVGERLGKHRSALAGRDIGFIIGPGSSNRKDVTL